jgi:hypothetical protein
VIRKILWSFLLALLAMAACAPSPRAALPPVEAPPRAQGPVAAAPTTTPSPAPSKTPGFSTIELPTAVPTMGGPMGTLTAIAPLLATPEIDKTPYEIEPRGKPHFVEFHAWW